MSKTLRVCVRVCLGVIGSAAAWAYPFGPPTAITMAPGDRPGVTCTACHSGTAVNGGGGSVRLAFPNGLNYSPGQAQTLTVTVTDSVASLYGFELTARMDNSPNNTPAGSFTAGTDQRIVCADNAVQPAAGCGGNGIQWIEHSAPSLTGVFTVNWTPPASAAGNVHLYVSANAANGDNTRLGDHIYCAEYVLTPASNATTGIPVVKSVGTAAGTSTSIEPGSWITITGTNFGTGSATWDNAIVANVYPTTLAGVTVLINGKPAPISFVNETQINALAPLDGTLGPVDVVVTNATGSSAAAKVSLVAAAPGFFTLNNKYIAGVVLDSAGASQLLAPAGSVSGATSRAAKAGETISLFGTAFGRTTTPLLTLMAANVAYPIAHSGPDFTAPTAQMTIGGQLATISFIGVVSPGVYQINAVVPPVAAGDQAVVLQLLSGPSTSTQTVFVPVQ